MNDPYMQDPALRLCLARRLVTPVPAFPRLPRIATTVMMSISHSYTEGDQLVVCTGGSLFSTTKI